MRGGELDELCYQTWRKYAESSAGEYRTSNERDFVELKVILRPPHVHYKVRDWEILVVQTQGKDGATLERVVVDEQQVKECGEAAFAKAVGPLLQKVLERGHWQPSWMRD